MWKNILLTRVETSTPETFATPFGIKIRRLIRPILRPILRIASGHSEVGEICISGKALNIYKFMKYAYRIINENGIRRKNLHAMASMLYEIMTEHTTILKRAEFGLAPRTDYMKERMREYLCTKWTRDDWAMEITCYRDKTLPPQSKHYKAD